MPEIRISIPREAAGLDGILCPILQVVSKEPAAVLITLFQRSHELTSEIPLIWKHAVVQPALQKGDRSQAANCWPISLTIIQVSAANSI